MDSMNNWKKILLQWIKECNFLEKNFYSIDQTDIEVFFMNFKNHFDGNICPYSNVFSFLKEQYPMFEPHFDDEHTISSSDYIYVYSLLLHFSCVRFSNGFFQENCKKLNEGAQRNIAVFFQKLINDEFLSKDTLRRGISSIQGFTPPNNRFLFNSESPVKTPKKNTDISPPTPRSCMLQEKNKKVYTLKAQLETLGYEKSVLETDLKNNQEKIDKLNLELKKAHQEIQDLKNEILSRSKEMGDCGVKHTGEEQIRRLSKKIAQREQEIVEQRDAIEDLTDQKECLNEKLKNAEKQMKLLQNNIAELAEKVDDLTHELEQKDYTIQNLSDAKSELEQYISEIRSSTVNSRPDLNLSSEFLDLSRATNSSGSIHSPENLGSVVDIKLREKENENEKLLEELTSIRIDNQKLCKAMTELTARYSNLFDVCNDNLIIDNGDDESIAADPANYFIIFSNCMENFAKKYEDNCFALNRIKGEAKQIEEQNLSQANRLDELQKLNFELKNEIGELLSANKSLQSSKTTLENTIVELENKLEDCIRQRSEEINNFKNLKKEFESYKVEKLDAEHSFREQIESFKSCLEDKQNFLTNLQLESKTKDRIISENQQKFEGLLKEKQGFEEKISDLKIVEKNLSEQLDHEKSQRTQLETKTYNLSCQLEETKQNYDVLLSEKKDLAEKNEEKIMALEQQIYTLTCDQNLKASTILELETKKNSQQESIESMQGEVQKFRIEVNEYEKRFKEAENQLTELRQQLLHTKTQCYSSRNELQNATSHLNKTNEVFSKLITYILYLVMVLKRQIGLEITQPSTVPLQSCDIDGMEVLDNKLKEQVKSLISEIETFKNDCSVMKKENSSLQTKISQLEDTTGILNREKLSLEMNVSQLEDERLKQIDITENLMKLEENLKNEIKGLTSHIEELKSEILDKTNDAEILLQKHKQSDNCVKELQAQIVSLENDSRTAFEKLETSNRELEATKSELESEVAEKNNATEVIKKLQLKISSLENQLTEINEAATKTSEELIQEYEKINIQLKNEIILKEQIEKVLEDIKLKFDNEVSKNDEITKNLENIKQELETERSEKRQVQQMQKENTQKFKEEMQKITLQLSKEITKTEYLIKDHANVKLQLETETKYKENLKNEFEESKSRLENEIKKHQVENSKIKEELESTKLQLENKFENENQLQKELVDVKTRLESEETTYKVQISKMKEELENTKLRLENEVKNNQKLKELLEGKNRLENEVTTLQVDLERARFELQKNIDEKSKITEAFESTKKLLESEVQIKNQLEKEMSKLTEDFESTKLFIESEAREKTQLKENLTVTKLDLEKELLESTQFKQELVDLKLQLESKVTEAHNANENLGNANKQLKALQLKVTDLETEKDVLNKFNEITKSQLENEILAKTELNNKLESANAELNELRAKIENLEAEIVEINQKANDNNNQLENVRLQLENEVSEKSKIKESFENIIKRIHELTNEKLTLEYKIQNQMAEADKHKSEVKRLQSQESRLVGEIEILKSTTESQIKKYNREADEQKENVSRLIQEIASIRKEKEFAEEERKMLSKRLECYLSEQTTKESSQRSTEEKLAVAEKEILVKLNLLKSEQLRSQDLENQLKKLQIEHAKLRDTSGSNIKRIEKQALMLGESQAKCQKLKKETDLAQSTLETTQRENARLNLEYKTLKEKLSTCEKCKDQLESRIKILQKELEKLTEDKKILEASENDLKTSNGSLEKVKHNLEDRIRKLVKSLTDSNEALSKLEQDKVQLNLEVGGLNKQLEEKKNLLNMKLVEIETLKLNLIDAKTSNSQLMELNEKHQSQAKEINDENSRLNDQLSKLSLRIKITQEDHETTKTELENLRSAIEVSKSEKDAIEKDHQLAIERLMGVEARRSTEVDFTNKIRLLEKQIDTLSANNQALEELRNKDKSTIEQFNADILIFQAKLQKSRAICEENEKKWAQERELLLDDVRQSQDRIKETRFELEGKLEKMKNKMKTLYNDEVSKMKKKQEREVSLLQAENDSLRVKNEKHEEHIKKLSSQIFRLNENILEYQKENTFLQTKLKDLENKPRQLSRVRGASSAPTPAYQVMSSNLRMEDEEGEIFNNTYLSDLKDGRMSEYFNTDICAQELQYRNSLLPPHLKSTYLAQFDHQMGEDEIRDTPSLDDSMSTLLNTGQRKKVSGATSYKRPGPPTPSKNAGRLSFGGIGELNREILKESSDIASCSSSSSKTPAKFKFFSSKLSMRGDERKSYVTNFKRKLLTGSTIQCSSTPRKSKAHIDQRRLLDQIMSTASPGPEFSPDCIVKPAVNLPSSLKNLESERRLSLYKWRQPKVTYASDSGNSDVNSPRMRDHPRYLSSGSRKRITKRAKDRRGSIYLRGTMFARNCRTPTTGFRETFKNKSKIQRIANFNKCRHNILNEMLIRKASLCLNNWDDETCNNNNNDFFLKEVDMKKDIMEDGSTIGDNDVNNDTTSQHFQKLLEDKESNAPFEISEIAVSNSNRSGFNVNNSSSNVHSRTIYGASVILNRKIPNVNTTKVRKSSIYVKGNDGKSVILVTNQTITLKDLAQMWLQMNVSAKTCIALSLTATLIVIISFVIQFIRR